MLASSDLNLVPGKKFTLIGTPQGAEIKDPSRSFSRLFSCSHHKPNLGHSELFPDVNNDLDVDFSENLAAAAAYARDIRNIRKIKEATQNLQVNVALIRLGSSDF
jgi:ubiquitin-like domain-containing CTD phosphatase 1